MEYILKILYIETEGEKLFIDKISSSVRELVNTKYGTYQYMLDK